MLAHELRNPLAPIQQRAASWCGWRPSRGATSTESHAMIERQVGHLTRLVDDLLDVSRITRGKIELHRERVELATAVRGAIEMVDGYVRRRGHELVVSLPERADLARRRPDPAGAGDLQPAAQRRQVHRAGRADLADGRAARATRSPSGSGTTGVGIAPEMLPRVFDLFTQGERTLDRSQGGPRASG